MSPACVQRLVHILSRLWGNGLLGGDAKRTIEKEGSGKWAPDDLPFHRPPPRPSYLDEQETLRQP